MNNMILIFTKNNKIFEKGWDIPKGVYRVFIASQQEDNECEIISVIYKDKKKEKLKSKSPRARSPHARSPRSPRTPRNYKPLIRYPNDDEKKSVGDLFDDDALIYQTKLI